MADGTSASPVKDAQTVTAAGERPAPKIVGVRVRLAVSHLDERGELTEIYDPAWNFDPEPVVYVYQTTVRPGRVKGWVVHYRQEDRMFISMGAAKIVLYDAREDSPTRGAIEEIHLGERRRGLLRIPRGVYHAVENIGDSDLLFVNMPTRAYQHADPDKYRLPLDTPQIPYRFDTRRGW